MCRSFDLLPRLSSKTMSFSYLVLSKNADSFCKKNCKTFIYPLNLNYRLAFRDTNIYKSVRYLAVNEFYSTSTLRTELYGLPYAAVCSQVTSIPKNSPTSPNYINTGGFCSIGGSSATLGLITLRIEIFLLKFN